MPRQTFAYSWSNQRNTYRVYVLSTGDTVSYHDNVDEARAKVARLNAGGRR